MNNRISFIDIARGIAIILIVFGHTISGNTEVYPIFRLLYSFHVILFFIISGYIYSPKDDLKSFILKRFKSIMIPYFIFSLLFIIPYFLFTPNIRTNGFEIFFKLIKEIIYGNGNDGALKQNTSLWFLPALFTTEILFKLFDLCNKSKYKHFINFVAFTIICYFGTKIKIIFPWGVNSAFCMLVFYEIGYLIKTKRIIEEIDKNKISRWSLVVMVIISMVLSQFNNTIACVNYYYGNNFLIFYLVALTLSVGILYISYKIGENKIMEYIGRNTISILIFHKLLIVIFQDKVNFTSGILKGNNIMLITITAILVSGLTIAFSILIGTIIKRYFPFLYGKINLKDIKINAKNNI